MAVVCGTDFSLNSARAVHVAAILAGRLHEPLVLLHVIDRGAELRARSALEADAARERLERVAERLRRHGLTVTAQVARGVPDEAIVACAGQTGGRLIVLSSLGRRAPGRWLLGSVAERTAQTSPVPVLVVRSTAAFRRWARTERPLGVVAGADRSATTDAAVRWLGGLAALGGVDVVIVHLYATATQRRRLGLASPLEPSDQPHPEIERVLRRDLEERAAFVMARTRTRLRLHPTRGRVAEDLVSVAAEEGADLLVVGTHQRRARAGCGRDRSRTRCSTWRR